jgi:hypothetical protein
MTPKAQVWSLPESKTILITDLIDIIPAEILEVNPNNCPALIYSPGCHIGRFATWQAGLSIARREAAQTGYGVVEDKISLLWEIEIPDWLEAINPCCPSLLTQPIQ